MDCLFCKIVKGEIPSVKIYEDDKIYVFEDIQPQAPVHALIIPKEHIVDTEDVTDNNAEIIGYIFSKIPTISSGLDVREGYRVVTNTGKHGQQTVPHLHFHLIGGRQLLWPPG